VSIEGRAEITLNSEGLEQLKSLAGELGIPTLGMVSLDHPGFDAARDALDEHLERGLHGDMDFMARTRAVRKDPAAMLPGASSLLVGLVPYRGQAGPVARYAQGEDYHSVLFLRFQALAERIEALYPGSEQLVFVDTKPVMERAAAALAGLGFLGKNGLLISRGLGSWVLIGGLLTTLRWSGPLLPHGPKQVLWDACGQCTRCLDACPTQAFEGPGRLDPRKCVAYLTIEHRGEVPEALAGALGERVAGCDLCQEVCPYNASEQREHRVEEASWAGGAFRPMPSLEELAMIRSGRHRAWVKGTALRRIPRRHLRRNALLALGNREGPTTCSERRVLEEAREDPNSLVSDAARWALRVREPGGEED
jgi:epoxyqueuosine reductase